MTRRRPPVVVITGASTGIGRACALSLDRRGARVFAGVRREDDAQALSAEASSRLTAIHLDVTDESTVAAARAKVAGAVGHGQLDGLVNNAGVAVAAPLEYVPLHDLRRQLEVNVVGQVAVTQRFLPLLRPARGRIVMMGSISGKIAAPFLGPYAASKHALEAITDSLRRELAPWDIRVSIIEPGAVDTPIWEKGQAFADALEAELGDDAQALYGEAIDAMRQSVRATAASASAPSAVVKAVEHALLARRPRTRYVVGHDARLQQAMAALLPDGVADRLIRRALRLPG